MKFGTIIFVGILPANFHEKKGWDMLFMRLRLAGMVCVIVTAMWCEIAALAAAEQQPSEEEQLAAALEASRCSPITGSGLKLVLSRERLPPHPQA